ncbi:transposase [Streptomyces sp. NPDC004111]|uniref:IS110 family transposase n=1 Tax=Streptomyces sp. NPDC004111 TaxID=3364690 RepID=UPI0036A0602D
MGALPPAVARVQNCNAARLPEHTVRRIADPHHGESRADAYDAFIIAAATHSRPHTLRAIDADDTTIAKRSMLVGADDDLVTEANTGSLSSRAHVQSLHSGLTAPDTENTVSASDHPARAGWELRKSPRAASLCGEQLLGGLSGEGRRAHATHPRPERASAAFAASRQNLKGEGAYGPRACV